MTGSLVLRGVTEEDLSVLFEHQLDPVACHMAAFTLEDPADRDAFAAHWARILTDETITKKVILLGGKIVGHVETFRRFEKREVSYWIAREYWGRGVATRALAELLDEVTDRPVYARAARDNAGSIRVLEKCGFEILGHDRGFAHARGEEVVEVILKLK